MLSSLLPDYSRDDGRRALVLLLVGLVLSTGVVHAQVDVQVVATGAEGIRSVHAADVDGDGRPDVMTAEEAAGTASWFPNREGAFGDRVVITDAAPGAAAIEPADLNGDGAVDIVLATYEEGHVTWYENRGAEAEQRFGDGRIVDDSLRGSIDVQPADLDGDGDTDLLATGVLDDRVVWYENRLEEDSTFADRATIATGVDGARAVVAADVDGDGRQDVLVAAQEESALVWFQHQNEGAFSSRKELAQLEGRPRSLRTADLDGDEDADVVAVHDNAVLWVENQGGAEFASAQTIADVDGGHAVSIGDLDEDGDPDIISASSGDDTIAWIENRLSSEGTFASLEALTTEANGAIDVHAADLDRDGTPDVLGASWWAQRAAVYYNRGIGAPSSPPAMTAEAVQEKAARIAWAPAPDADVEGYRVYRADASFETASGGTAVTSTLVADTTVVDTGRSADHRHFYRVAAVDSSGREGPLSDTASVIPRPVEPAPPTGLAATLQEGTAALDWTANSEPDVVGYRVYRAQQPFDAPAAATRLDTGRVPESAFSDSSLSTGGMTYYRIAAVDADSNESTLSETASLFYYPERVAVAAERSFGDGADPQDFRLVALPGAVERPLSATFSGEPNVNWRAFWDNGSESDPFVRFDGSDRFTFRPGLGFWVIGTTPWQVEESVSTVLLRGDSTAVIGLHDGWNIISNPLEKDVTWRSVAAANDGTLQALWQFADGFEEAFLFRSARRGEAYYFLNAQGLDSLRIPYPNAPTQQRKSSSSPGLRLTATDSSEHQSAVRVRSHPEARSGIDPYDQVAPTPRFEAVSLRLDAPDGTAPRRRHLAEEVRPPGAEGHTFDLTLRASPDSRLRLTAEDLRDGPWAHAVLINEATGRRHDLHNRSTVSLTPSEEETDVSLRVGTADFVEGGRTDERPAHLQLEAPRPNPVHDHTTLVYALPEKTEVRLTVFDVMGRQVRTARTAAEAGRHRMQFPVNDLASGVYFLRLQAGGEMRTRKLTVVR